MTFLSSFVRLYATTLTAFPWVGGLIVIGLTVAACAGWFDFGGQDRNYITWEERSDAAEQAELDRARENMAAFYALAPDMLLVLEAEDFFQPDTWNAITDACAALERLDIVYQVDWIAKLPGFRSPSDRALNPSSIGLSEWFQLPLPFNPSPDDETNPSSADINDEAEWRRFRERAIEQPIIAGQLLSADAHTMVIHVWVSGYTTRENVDAIRNLVRDHLEPHQVRVRATGNMPLRVTHKEAFDRSHYRVLGAAVLVIAIIAILMFRDIRSLLLVGVGPFLGILWTMGIFELIGEPSNELTDMVLPVMLLIVAFADVVHLVIDLRRHQSAGDPPSVAVQKALFGVGPACIMTSITTAVGFGSLIMSDSEVIRSFGRSSALGVMISLVAVIMATPLLALLTRGCARTKVSDKERVERPKPGLTERMLDFPARHAVLISALAFVGLIPMLYQSAQLQPDDRLVDRLPIDSEAVQAMQHCDQALGGAVFVEVFVEWSEKNDLEQMEQILAATESALKEEELFGSPISARTWLSLVPTQSQKPNLRYASLLPERIGLVFWREDERRARVVARVQDLGLITYDPVLKRTRERLDKLAAKNPGVRYTLTGLPIETARTVRDVVRGLFGSLLTAAIIIFLLITAALRSIKLGLICILPNALPLLAAATMRSLLSDSLDIASACAFVISLGIAVDDTIHIVWRYRHESLQGGSMESVLHRTLLKSGIPVIMTSVVLVCGISTVALSSLPTHRYFAAIAGTTLAGALAADLVILPAMLAIFDRRRLQAAEK